MTTTEIICHIFSTNFSEKKTKISMQLNVFIGKFKIEHVESKYKSHIIDHLDTSLSNLIKGFNYYKSQKQISKVCSQRA